MKGELREGMMHGRSVGELGRVIKGRRLSTYIDENGLEKLYNFAYTDTW